MTNAVPQICEIVGPPGAGKTTFIGTATSGAWKDSFQDLDDALLVAICRMLSKTPSDALRDKPYRSHDPLESRKRFLAEHFGRSQIKLSGALDFIAGNVTYARHVLDAVETVSDEAERRLILSWLFTLFAKYQCVISSDNNGQLVLIDEGFVGRVITLFAYRPVQPASEEIRKYIRLIPKPRAVIRLKLASDECLSRLMKRPEGPPTRFRPRTDEQRLTILQNCQRCIETAQAELSAMGVPVFDVDGALDPLDQVSVAFSALGLSRPSPPLHVSPGASY